MQWFAEFNRFAYLCSDMKVALIGYGKMGHIIEHICRQRGHEIVSIIDADNTCDFATEAYRSADVAIEFSTPTTAVENYMQSFCAGVPIVSGTTGWLDRMEEVKTKAAEAGVAMFYASNFSVGVNIFMALNRYLATLMNNYDNYTPQMTEIHHIHKLDHPSGTAITLAEGIVEQTERISDWSEEAEPNKLTIAHRREGEVPGTHIISWESEVDSITITHEAKSRAGFALGAVLAAEWIVGKEPQFYSMADMMKF